MVNELFVYGTLRLGLKNRYALLLAESATFLGAAFVRGRLYRVSDYPGLVLDDDARDCVRGDLFRLHHPDETLTLLDDYEGSDYRRVPAAVSVIDSRESLTAWTYVYNGDLAGKVRIESGDFLQTRAGLL
jgi:gamma-glutamylcyclotransferase (GGCT)/AIG2-like uncharacterized protein YtfP